MNFWNKAQVDELFRREAILIGVEDVVLVSRAEALFGEENVKFNLDSSYTPKFWKLCSAEDHRFQYLTYRGFLAVATTYNVRKLCMEYFEECEDEGTNGRKSDRVVRFPNTSQNSVKSRKASVKSRKADDG